jgi:hypothetical protein
MKSWPQQSSVASPDGKLAGDPAQVEVVRLAEVGAGCVDELLKRYGIEWVRIADGSPIPGSYWGESEAGLIGNRLFWRGDTPLHSVLHETGHFICMEPARRARLDRDAGGDDAEENAVCYLQVVLADALDGYGRPRCLRDMDAWGYSFRLGSARAWFETDAADARVWLEHHRILDGQGLPTGRRRGD